MELAEFKTIGVNIYCPFDRANAFLGAPTNFAQWAKGLGQSLKQVNGEWIFQTPTGPVSIVFTPPNALGVIDHSVILDPDHIVYVPMRVVSNRDGSHVSLTLFRQPGMSADQFAADAQLVRDDLERLRAILET
jgi:hypothetical protein